MRFNCIPLKVLVLIDHCLGCDNIIPFDSDGHCWLCGCDMPFGSIDDDELTQQDFDKEHTWVYFEIKTNDKPIFKNA